MTDEQKLRDAWRAEFDAHFPIEIYIGSIRRTLWVGFVAAKEMALSRPAVTGGACDIRGENFELRENLKRAQWKLRKLAAANPDDNELPVLVAQIHGALTGECASLAPATQPTTQPLQWPSEDEMVKCMEDAIAEWDKQADEANSNFHLGEDERRVLYAKALRELVVKG